MKRLTLFLCIVFGLPALAQEIPTDGLVLRLDPNALTAATGTRIGEWRNASGTAVFVQKDEALRPELAMDEKRRQKVLRFTGKQFLAGPAVLPEGAKKLTIAAVWMSRSSDGAHSVFEQASPGRAKRAALLLINSSYGFCGEHNNSFKLAPVETGRWTQSVLSLSTDGKVIPSHNGQYFQGKINIGAHMLGTEKAQVGAKFNDSEFFDGEIGEILVWNRDLNETERSVVNQYLGKKWSIEISTKPEKPLTQVKGERITENWEKTRNVPGEKEDYLPRGKLHEQDEGELLYNGIRLPATWPPRNFDFQDTLPQPPYLKKVPKVIPIDVGRQLFVDDFLIESTTLTRTFHKPKKYNGNPVLRPETPLELNQGINPVAAPFSDGAFYDPSDKLFKLWYHAGWFDGVALAVSKDGLSWTRPELDVVPGSNRVVAQREDFRRDGVSVWLDHDAKVPGERFKMFYYARTGKLGGALTGVGGHLLTSPDGVHWDWRGPTGASGDNTTFFYNPFRKVWVFSHRARLTTVRVRRYWENTDFLAAMDDWDKYKPVFWGKADSLDPADPQIQETPQLYKIDAAPYESLMIGIFQILLGPANEECAKTGRAKLTDLQIAFSRDGFHWDRSNRDSFISATQRKEDWDCAYVTPAGGICNVVGDKLHFYYGAFQGDATNLRGGSWNGMYANASTGLAILRRDGFASMDAGRSEGTLTTRPVTFKGRHLFVNTDCPGGRLKVEILNPEGAVIAPFTLDNCVAVSCDNTQTAVTWKGSNDLSKLSGKPVQFRFHLTGGSLYAFWVSPDVSGASYGYVAAGGPGCAGPIDTTGRMSDK